MGLGYSLFWFGFGYSLFWFGFGYSLFWFGFVGCSLFWLLLKYIFRDRDHDFVIVFNVVSPHPW